MFSVYTTEFQEDLSTNVRSHTNSARNPKSTNLLECAVQKYNIVGTGLSQARCSRILQMPSKNFTNLESQYKNTLNTELFVFMCSRTAISESYSLDSECAIDDRLQTNALARAANGIGFSGIQYTQNTVRTQYFSATMRQLEIFYQLCTQVRIRPTKNEFGLRMYNVLQ